MKGNRLWLLGAVAAIAAVVLLGWVLGISPKLAEASTAAAQQAAVDAQNVAQKAQLEVLREQYSNLDTLEADLEKLRLAVPDSPEVDQWIDSIQAAAVASGVVLRSVTAAEPGVYGVALDAGAPPAPEGAIPPPGATAPDNVVTIGVIVEVNGPPDAVIRFSRLAQLGTRIFVAPVFNYSPADSLGTLNGFIYVITDPAAPPKPSDSAVDDAAPRIEPTPDPISTGEPEPSPPSTTG